MLKKRKSKKFRLNAGKIAWSFARTFLIIVLSFVIIYPLLKTISHAFMPPAQYSDPSIVWVPKSLTWVNIQAAMSTLHYGHALLHTSILCLGCAFLQVVSSAYVGYGFARFRFPGRGLLFAMVILTIVVPINLLFIPMMTQYRFFDWFGLKYIVQWIFGVDISSNLLGTYWTFFLPSLLGVGVRSGLFIYIFRQYFRNIPHELEEAAQIDGCGPWSTFLKIMVPNAFNSAITVFLFSVVWHWNETMMSNAFFTTDKTLAVLVQNIDSSVQVAVNAGFYEESGRNYASAAGMRYGALVLFLVPVLLLYIGAQRYFIEGIESSGIKG